MPATEHAHRVLCVGDMVADIAASPVPRLPEPGEMLLTDEIGIFTGGNALNTAVALRRLGESVAMAGSVGDDPLGALVLAQLEQIGLDARGVRRERGAITPATLIFRAEGEDRRFVHALGVAAGFTGEDVPVELIPEGGVLFIGGYLKLTAWRDDALATTFRHATQRKCKVVFNVSIPREGNVETDRCLRLLPHVDVFVPNEDEARSPGRRRRCGKRGPTRSSSLGASTGFTLRMGTRWWRWVSSPCPSWTHLGAGTASRPASSRACSAIGTRRGR
jgi:sugar/nucleoside kinase (ribokinase family)